MHIGCPAAMGSSAGSNYKENWQSPDDSGSQTMHYWFVENLFDKGMLWGDAFFQAQDKFWRTRHTDRGFRVSNLFVDPALNLDGVRIAATDDDVRIHQGAYHSFAVSPDNQLMIGIARPWGRFDTTLLMFSGSDWQPVASGIDMAAIITALAYNGGRAYVSTGSVYGNIYTIDRFLLAPSLHPGDVDGNSVITLADAILAMQVTVNLDTPTITTRGDIDFNGSINLAEAIYVLRKIAASDE